MRNSCSVNFSGPPVPKVVDHEQRRRELVAATWAVVAAEGIEAATVRRIAEEAGCTTGRITHYFADKEEVLVAALRQVHRAAGKRMLAATGERSGLEALRAVLAEALPLDEERILEWRVWLAFWGSAATSTSLQAEQHQRYREWRGLLKRVLATAALPTNTSIWTGWSTRSLPWSMASASRASLTHSTRNRNNWPAVSTARSTLAPRRPPGP